MDNNRGTPNRLEDGFSVGARHLTMRYILTFCLLGCLALGNYLILRAQIETGRSISAVYVETGGQRSQLQGSALLAQKLVVTADPQERIRVRSQLNKMIASLETTHHRLLRDESGVYGLPKEVRAIYFDPPWSLNDLMIRYIAEVHALAATPDNELNWTNPHILYIFDAAMSGHMVDALNQVASAYQKRSDQRTAYLLWLAIWTAGSTIVVLVISGLFVFRPMVRHVRQDMDMLRQFNETLEQRVAERSALAEQRAEESAVSEALYRSLVDNLPLHVNRKDLQGRFTFVNDSFCRFLGKPREAILGKTNFDFFSAELAEKYHCYDKQVIEQGKIYQALEQIDSADGTPRHLEMLKTPVKSGGGEIVETQTVYLDVTGRMETERRLTRSERLAAIGNVVAGVAHESRNALQQLQACAGLLEEKISGDKEAEALLADLQKAQDRLHRLFEDLRSYASPLTLDVRKYDLQKAVGEAWSALAQSREGRDVTLQIHPAEAGITCQVDPLRLEQVFLNIMENALGACEDPVVLDVVFSADTLPGGPALCVTIRDNGPGFTPEQKQQAFEPFYTTKAQGTGLGLTIVKRIVEAHGGEIALGNSPTQGAEIRINLPKENI
jgi:PAS domain S-box-containing protein